MIKPECSNLEVPPAIQTNSLIFSIHYIPTKDRGLSIYLRKSSLWLSLFHIPKIVSYFVRNSLIWSYWINRILNLIILMYNTSRSCLMMLNLDSEALCIHFY